MGCHIHSNFVFAFRLLLGRLISPLLPEMQMGRIRVEQVTSDTEMQARLNSDKLRWTGGVKLGLGLAFLTCLENMHKEGLWINGNADRKAHAFANHSRSSNPIDQ